MMLVAAAAMGFTACSKDATEDFEAVAQATETITISTDITRTTLNADRTQLTWVAGDQFAVYTDQGTKNTPVTYTEGAVDFDLEVAAGSQTVYAYYPYFKNQSANSSQTAVSLYVTSTQNQKEAGVFDGNANDYVMVAKGAIDAEKHVALTFKPVACALAFNIYGGQTEEKVESVTFDPGVVCAGQHYMDITVDNPVYTAANGAASSVTVTLENPFEAVGEKPADPKAFANQVYAVVARKAYEGATMTVKTSLNTYTFKTASTLDLTTDFFTMNLNLAKGETPAPASVPTGNVVILAEKDTDYYAVSSNNNVKGTNNSDRRDNILFTYNKEEYVSTTDETLVWNIQKTGAGTYTIKSVATSKYINSGDNLAPMSTTAENFNITLNSEGYYEIVPASGNYTDRRFEQNNQKIGFGFYAKTQNAKILIVPASLKPSVSVTEKEFAIAADNTAEHTFTCTVSGEGAELTDVTLTQDDASMSWLTASYADGTVTYKAAANETDTPRTATLTLAIADGNSVEITVTQAAPIKKLVVTMSVEGTTVSWTASASPVVGYNYTVTADIAGTSDVLKSGENVEETSLDLSTLGLETGTYYLHVQALGDNIATSDSDIVTSEGIAVEKGDAPILEEDFAALTKDNNTGTSQNTAWNGNTNFPSVTNAYQAGGAVKIGASKKTGSLTSKPLDLSKPFTVTVQVKGWTTVEGTLIITVGTQKKTITYTEKLSDAFGTYSVDFEAETNASTITIATSAKRAFIDDVKVAYK